MPVAGVFLIAAMGGAAATADPVQIELTDRHIRVGDVAIVPGKERVVIGVLPAGTISVDLSEAKARSLVANRLPGSDFTLRYSGPVRLSGPAAAPARGTCWQSRQVIAAGDVILDETVVETPCGNDTISAGLGFDRNRGRPVATRFIEAGAYLGAIRPARSEGIEAGKVLTFQTTQGPVTVERQVTALQNGETGSKIFARTAEGEVIAAPVLASAKETDQ